MFMKVRQNTFRFHGNDIPPTDRIERRFQLCRTDGCGPVSRRALKKRRSTLEKAFRNPRVRRSPITDHLAIPYGLGCGVGRSLGIGAGRGVGVGRIVAVGEGVDVAVGVGVGVDAPP